MSGLMTTSMWRTCLVPAVTHRGRFLRLTAEHYHTALSSAIYLSLENVIFSSMPGRPFILLYIKLSLSFNMSDCNQCED